MSIINFSIPAQLNKKIQKTVKNKGFASRAEFFRFAAQYALGNIAPADPLDKIIAESKADYEHGDYKTAYSAKTLLRDLKN